MKRFMNIKALLLAAALTIITAGVTFSIVGVPVLVQRESGLFTLKATFAGAVAATDSANRTIYVMGYTPISDTVTVPATKAVKVVFGGYFAGSGSLVINGPFEATGYVFQNSGTVTGLREVTSEWYGAKVDDGADDAPAIQRAIDSVYATGGGLVKNGAGTYDLLSMHAIPGTSAYYLLDSKDKVSVKGVGNSTILKAGPGLRTSTAGMAILYNHTQYISHLTISDMTIDYNGQNNLIQDGWSSTSNISRTGGDIAHNVTIARIHFRNISGHHAVWFGATATDARNSGNKMTGCVVEEVCDAIPGNQSSDFSGIYCYSDNSEVTNNKFFNSVQSYKATAMEIGGNNVIATGNTVSKYGTAVNAAAIFGPCFGMTVSGNSFYSVTIGVRIWTGMPPAGSTNYTLNNLTITANPMVILDTQGTIYSYSKGIEYSGTPDVSTTSSSNWVISDNPISMMLNAPTAFNNTPIAIDLNPVINLTITNNPISSFKGEAIRLNDSSNGRAFSNVKISGNPIEKCGYTSTAGHKQAIYVGNNPAAPSGNILITDNPINGGVVGSSTPMNYGIYFNPGGAPKFTQIKGNTVLGASIFDIYAVSFQETPYYFLIDHVAQKGGSPSAQRLTGTHGSRWVDSTTNYVYHVRDFISGTTSNGISAWLADIDVSGDPSVTAPYNTGTWKRGSRATPVGGYTAVGSPKGWICTISGTGGTLAGVTGSITSGTKSLAVNTAAGLQVGQFITIAGVTGVKQITAIAGTTVTIDSNASATVSGAAVAYQPPTWVSIGNL